MPTRKPHPQDDKPQIERFREMAKPTELDKEVLETAARLRAELAEAEKELSATEGKRCEPPTWRGTRDV